jgi:hypothetical protein
MIDKGRSPPNVLQSRIVSVPDPDTLISQDFVNLLKTGALLNVLAPRLLQQGLDRNGPILRNKGALVFARPYPGSKRLHRVHFKGRLTGIHLP